MKKKNALVIFPPQWCPFNPYPSVPTLVGCLNGAGFPARGLDLNIRFYRSLFTREQMERAVERACRKGCATLPDRDRAETVCRRIEESLAVFRDEDLFYDPERLFRAKADLNDALEIVSAPYAPSRLMITDYFHRSPLYDFETIVAESEDPDANLFYSFLQKAAEEIAGSSADYLLISVTDVTQILPLFTLCGFLKKTCDKPVCVGGNIVTKLKSAFLSERRFFDAYTDFVACGPGETATVAFAEYMHGLRPAEEVPGLLYRDADGAVRSNPESPAGFPAVALPDYAGLDLGDYLSPAPDCSIQLSRGCYWGKCAFCDVSFNRESYAAKPVEIAIREISHLAALGVRHIHLGDSSVSPAYFDKLCDAILERDLHIFLFAFARLERAFTPALFAKMYRAGVRLIFWGYESQSERVMAMINKGLDNDRRLAILRMSAEAGIWNHVSFMIGFPGETREEGLETLRVIRENRDVVDSCFLARFSFKTNAKIHEDTRKYGLDGVKEKGSFSTECFYRAEGMTKEEIRSLSQDFRRAYLNDNLDTLWPMVCDDLEHLLFYLSRYGREGVRGLRVSDRAAAATLYRKYLL